MVRSTRGASGTIDIDSEKLDLVFAALAHPGRRRILVTLSQGPLPATALGKPLAMSQPAVSKHLKVLEEAGLIIRGRDAQRRPCELRTDVLDAALDWISSFEASWEDRMERLGEYLGRAGASASDEGKQDGN